LLPNKIYFLPKKFSGLTTPNRKIPKNSKFSKKFKIPKNSKSQKIQNSQKFKIQKNSKLSKIHKFQKYIQNGFSKIFYYSKIIFF